MRQRWLKLMSYGGAFGTAVAASACCVGPLIFALLGLGGAGALVALEPYRPMFTLFTVVFLAAGWWLNRGSLSSADPDDCGCERPKVNRLGRYTLWFTTFSVFSILVFPFLTPYIFGD